MVGDYGSCTALWKNRLLSASPHEPVELRVNVSGTVRHLRCHGKHLSFLELEFFSDTQSWNEGKDRKGEEQIQVVLSRKEFVGHSLNERGCNVLSALPFDSIVRLCRSGTVWGFSGELRLTKTGCLSIYAVTATLEHVPPTLHHIERLLNCISASGASFVASDAVTVLCGAQTSASLRRETQKCFERLIEHTSQHCEDPTQEIQVKHGLVKLCRALSSKNLSRLRPHKLSILEKCVLQALKADPFKSAQPVDIEGWTASHQAPDIPEGYCDEAALRALGAHPEDNYCLARGTVEDARLVQYCNEKKGPQVAWMVREFAQLIQQQNQKVGPLRVWDVGGGRGDLAIALASWFKCRVQVKVLDISETSLAQGYAVAKERGLNNIEFLHVDIADLLKAQQQQHPSLANDTAPGGLCDVLVALHACGGLTDAAMELAGTFGAPFLIVPCCYCKHQALGDLCSEDHASLKEPFAEGLTGRSQTLYAAMMPHLKQELLSFHVKCESLTPQRLVAIVYRLAESPDNAVSSVARRAIAHCRSAYLEETYKVHSISLVAFSRNYSEKNIVMRGELSIR